MLLSALYALLVGGFGLFGVFAYAMEPQSNPSRYQLTIVPILAFIAGLPATVLGLYDIWRQRKTITAFTRLLFFACFSLPVASVGGLAIVDWIQANG